MQCFTSLLFFSFFFFFFGLLVHGNLNDYHQCSSNCPQQTILFSQPLIIPNECQENNLTDIFHPALICLIDYRIDYDAQHIYIHFKATNDTTIFEGMNYTEYLIQTLWLGFSFDSNQPNITHRQYGCTTADDCARDFYLKTIKHLINKAPIQLAKMHRKLYNQSSLTSTNRRCIDSRRRGNRTAISCHDGLCYAHQTHQIFNDKHQYSREQQCRRESTPTFFSETQHYLPELIPYARESIEYTCNKHLCNRKETIEVIRKILNDYTRWNLPDQDELPLQIKSSNGDRRRYSFELFLITMIIVFRQLF